MNKRTKRLLLLTIALNLTIVTLCITTYAWFADINRTGSVMFSAGNVNYSLNNTDQYFITSDEIIVPGQELVILSNADGIPIINKSSIETHLRMKIIVSYQRNGVLKTLSVDDSPDSEVIVQMVNQEQTTLWLYDSDSSYWYYQPPNEEQTIPIRVDNINGDEILSLSSLKFNGQIIGNDSSTVSEITKVEVKIIIQAKQAQFVDWPALESSWRIGTFFKTQTYQKIYKLN